MRGTWEIPGAVPRVGVLLTMYPPWLARSSGVQPCLETLESTGTPRSTSRCTCAASPVCEAQCRSRIASTSTGMTGAAGITVAGGSFGVAEPDRRRGTLTASPRISLAEGGPRGNGWPPEADLKLSRVSAALVGRIRCGNEALELRLRRRSRDRRDCFILSVIVVVYGVGWCGLGGGGRRGGRGM